MGLCETLRVFIDNRVAYLRYGLEELSRERGVDSSAAFKLFPEVEKWKKMALDKARELFLIHRRAPRDLQRFLILLQEYSLAVYMATDCIQRVWGESGNAEFLVEKMYHYLYDLYPPLFPGMIARIDSMDRRDVEEYFQAEEVRIG